MQPNGSKRRGFAVGDPARRSRDGDGKRAVRGGEAMAAKRTNRTGSFRAAKRRARFCAANPKGGADDRPTRFRRGRNGAEWRQAPGFCRWGPGAAQPCRDGKRAVRGDEAMAAKRTTAPGRFARRNAAPDFAQKPSKPVRPARCPHGPRYGPAGVHRMFLRPPLGLPFSSWRQLRTKMRTISSTS